MNDTDRQLIRASFEVARKARSNGNHPFGAVLVDTQGEILLEAENTVVTDKDCTGHAETNLVRQASQKYSPEFLATCSIYTSTEPCPMCSGAIFWANIKRVVYGLSEEALYAMGDPSSQDVLLLSCHDVFSKGRKDIVVLGPLLEDEARDVHEGFWH